MPKIIPTPGLGSPAAIYHDNCDEVLIDPEVWASLEEGEKRFIIEHELAHCQFNTQSELSADRIGAIKHLVKGGKTKDILSAIELTRDPKRINKMKGFLRPYRTFSRFGPTDEEILFSESADELEKAKDASESRGFDVDNDFLIDIIEILGSTAGDIWGAPDAPAPAEPQDNTPTILLIGGIVVVMLLIFILLAKR